MITERYGTAKNTEPTICTAFALQTRAIVLRDPNFLIILSLAVTTI